MEVIGKIIVDLPMQSGTSKTGNAWKKKEYVLETEDTYPKKIHFDFFGDRADQYQLTVGQRVRLSFDIESREYNGRWYTSIRGWKSEPAAMPGVAGTPAPAAAPAYPGAAPAFPEPAAPAAPAYGSPFPGATESAPNDDLPF